MFAPKSVRVAESLQSPETKGAGVLARKALWDKNLKDTEADAIILAYNAMPHAVAVCTREQYRKSGSRDALHIV